MGNRKDVFPNNMESCDVHSRFRIESIKASPRKCDLSFFPRLSQERFFLLSREHFRSPFSRAPEKCPNISCYTGNDEKMDFLIFFFVGEYFGFIFTKILTFVCRIIVHVLIRFLVFVG